MAMVVKNNMSAVSTLNTLNKNSNALQKSLSKVSSGMKINSAQDDASGYAISERMRVQIRSLDQANQNTQNGSSMMKTAEGAVSSTVEILKSLKEKAINAANDTNKDADRVTIQKEIDQFIDQIDDNALTTFNGKYLVDGSKAQQGSETYTAMTNQSLATETKQTTALTALKNRNNESLEIASTDYVTASFVQNGNTYTTKFNVGTDSKLEDIFLKLNKEYTTASGDSAAAIFGAANTDTSEPMTSDTAKSIVNSATKAEIFKAAKGDNTTQMATAVDGTNYTVDKIKQAINVLNDADKLGEISSTDFATDTAVQRQTLVNTIEAQFTSVSNAVTATKVATTDGFTAGDEFSATLTSSGTTTAGATETLTLGTASVTQAAAAAGTATTTNGFSTTLTASGYSAKVMESVDNVISKAITDGAYVDDAVKDAVTSATTVTMTGNSLPTNKSLNGWTAPSAATVSDGDKYATSVALMGMISQGAVEVLDSKNIGLNAAGDMVETADGEIGLTVTAANKGVSGQISGLTISITDSEGNVKKAANASLDAFSTTIYAKNASDRNELSFQVGAAANQAIAVGLEDMRSEALGLKGSDGTKVSVATQDKANAAVNVFDNAIQKALDQQTTIGSIEARLEYTSQNLTTSSENVQAAESTIRDADMAKEMTNYTKNNVLLQAAQSMLAQANQSSSAVLSLLQ